MRKVEKKKAKEEEEEKSVNRSVMFVARLLAYSSLVSTFSIIKILGIKRTR
jgi:hypothetical protein